MEHIAPTDLITIEEAATILGKTVPTLRTWRLAGKGPRAAVIGRQLQYVRSEVEGYIAQEFAEQNERSA